MRSIRKLLRCERGATIVEYGLVVALIVIVMLVGLRTFAGGVISLYNNVSNNVVNAGNVT